MFFESLLKTLGGLIFKISSWAFLHKFIEELTESMLMSLLSILLIHSLDID